MQFELLRYVRQIFALKPFRPKMEFYKMDPWMNLQIGTSLFNLEGVQWTADFSEPPMMKPRAQWNSDSSPTL
jgi:hypothetical protein